jgi:hypothetical protein
MLLASAGWYIKLTYSGSSRLIREAVNLFAKCISSRFSRNIYIYNLPIVDTTVRLDGMWGSGAEDNRLGVC